MIGLGSNKKSNYWCKVLQTTACFVNDKIAVHAWQDLKTHLNLRKGKRASVPTQITSRFEDQLEALKSRGYKEAAVLFQFQKVLLRSREEVMKKVERPEDERAIVLAVPFDRRLPDVAKILHQHYNLLVQRNPGVKEWMRRAPMVAHLRPANLRDFLVRAKLPTVDRRRRAGRGADMEFVKNFQLFAV